MSLAKRPPEILKKIKKIVKKVENLFPKKMKKGFSSLFKTLKKSENKIILKFCK